MGYLVLLRNIFGAANLVCKLQIEVQIELWWEPKTKGLDNRGQEDGCHQPGGWALEDRVGEGNFRGRVRP